jgi:hypothetical protein
MSPQAPIRSGALASQWESHKTRVQLPLMRTDIESTVWGMESRQV